MSWQKSIDEIRRSVEVVHERLADTNKLLEKRGEDHAQTRNRLEHLERQVTSLIEMRSEFSVVRTIIMTGLGTVVSGGVGAVIALLMRK